MNDQKGGNINLGFPFEDGLNDGNAPLPATPRRSLWDIVKQSLGTEEEEEKNDVRADPIDVSVDQVKFGSSVGIVLSCLGCVVGTGNIWRFPRICALNSSSEGSLVFLIVWVAFLALWSIPLTIVEYTLGRFTRSSPFVAFLKFLKVKFLWVGTWVVTTTTLIACYYSVVVGWTVYYLVIMTIMPQLPKDEASSQEIFTHFTQVSWWPLICHSICLAIACACIYGGLKWMEMANMILVPLLLLIILFTFSWSLTRPYSEAAIIFLFTPSMASFRDPSLWIAAVTQNAFDTGAGQGSFTTYSSFFTRTDGSIRYAMTMPVLNNLVSMICGMTVFSTVFSSLLVDNPTLSKTSILMLMKASGPGGTGLTFTWIPVLFSHLGIMGRILCSLYFLCLSFAGITTLISFVQLVALCFTDFGLSQKVSLFLGTFLMLLVGVPSAIWVNFLTNQDNTWAYALILSGTCFSLLVTKYGVERYRRVVINEFGIGDWKMYKPWNYLISYFIPLEAMILIGWWIYDSTNNDLTWYIPSLVSLSTVLLEWLLLIILIFIFTFVCCKLRPKFLDDVQKRGYDPFNPNYVPAQIIAKNQFKKTCEVTVLDAETESQLEMYDDTSHASLGIRHTGQIYLTRL
ncbi:hypothetical protein Ciccas_004325 [Cichlidogyrus casuarinus]|uniref:Uncharacterized protein n=1 Tax=Cichlidogyrus casuarinus TaxID=1844966 RepID=A0ABD2QBS6_9PLAT